MAKKAGVDAGLILQILVAAFLITLGLVIIINYNDDLSKLGRNLGIVGKRNDPVTLVIGIADLVAGIIIAAALFISINGKMVSLLTLIVLIIWLVQIIIKFFVNDIFEPDFLIWLNQLSVDLIILGSLWLINRKYA